MKFQLFTSSSDRVLSVDLLRLNTINKTDYFHSMELASVKHPEIAYSYLSTPLFGILHLNINAKQSGEVICDFDGSAIIMSFTRSGVTNCEAKEIFGSMSEKQNNIFFNDCNVRCKIKEAECFRIVLSEIYVKKLSCLYPETIKYLTEAIKNRETRVFDRDRHLNTTLEMEQIIDLFKNMFLQKKGNEMLLEAKIRELLWMQIEQFLSSRKRTDQKLEKNRRQMLQTAKFIEDNIHQKFSLQEIAMQAGVCSTTLKTAFKYFYGTTVFGYLNKYRLNKACELLQHTTKSVGEIACMCGYESLSHFSTAFSQKYKMTALEYRKRIFNGATPNNHLLSQIRVKESVA